MYHVHFKFEQKNVPPITIKNVASGDSILEVALKNDIDLHHNCGGVCACTTCHVYVEKGGEYIEEMSEKEEDFIDRAVQPKLNSRLGCQSILQDGKSGDIYILVPDQTQFLGE